MFPIIIANAASDPITDINSKALSDVYGYVLGISTSLAVLSLAICIVRYMSSGNPDEAAQYKDDGKQVIIAWIIINILGAIISTALGLVSDLSGQL